ncbi:hypothetical protein RQ479_04110 [Mesorhizobium sp. ISC25]|uniref:hypothetical protein n=1 Tax=Mesorhizobium sp. ISC25 TaxID=3077335 RepID=UPI0035D7F5A1
MLNLKLQTPRQRRHMQDRYAGDVGDYIKLALIRTLSAFGKVGVSWYLYPDERHNADGRHTAYLYERENWRYLDPELFDLLQETVLGSRSVQALHSAFDKDSYFAAEPVPIGLPASERSTARKNWFDRSLDQLTHCDLVFADPDNGLVGDEDWRRKATSFGKQIPLSEARALSAGRCAVIYHHNSRFKGGHDAEVDSWLRALGMPAIAVRATAYSCRSFFVVNPDTEIVERTRAFCDRWKNHKVRLHASTSL